MIPATQQAREIAVHGVIGAREWSAPRLEQAAHYVETDLGPRVGSLLSKTAHKVEPAGRRRRGRNAALMTVAAVGLAGAIGAMASRRNSMNTLSHPGDVLEPSSMGSESTDGEVRIP